MLRLARTLVMALFVLLVAGPNVALADTWSEMTTQERNQITNTPQWGAMERTIERAGFSKVVSHAVGYEAFTEMYNGYTKKVVMFDYTNAAANKFAVITYTTGRTEDLQDYDFYSYVVFQMQDGVLVDDVYSWDSPLHIGDDSRIVNIMKGFGICMGWVGVSTVGGALFGGAVGGPGGALVGGGGAYLAGTYSCLGSAHAAWVSGHP